MENTQTGSTTACTGTAEVFSIENVKKTKKLILDRLISSHEHIDFAEKDMLINCLKAANKIIERESSTGETPWHEDFKKMGQMGKALIGGVVIDCSGCQGCGSYLICKKVVNYVPESSTP